MVPCPRTSSEQQLWKRSGYLGCGLHHGWNHWWRGTFPGRVWNRLTLLHLKNFGQTYHKPARRIQQKSEVHWSKISRYSKTRNIGKKVCGKIVTRSFEATEGNSMPWSNSKIFCNRLSRLWMVWWHPRAWNRPPYWSVSVTQAATVADRELVSFKLILE